MSLSIALAAEAVEHTSSLNPFVPAGIAFVVFLLLGVVTWSYRDVANRHTRQGTDHNVSNPSGH